MSSDNQPSDSERQQLNSLREQIDQIDQQIGELISQRARCALKVAQVKQQFASAQAPMFYRPEREAEVLRKAMQRNTGPLQDEEFARLFREIMSACLALEHPLRVAFLGPEGTYTHQAALKHFGHSVNVVPMAAIDEVFREVASGAAGFGVVPVENSTEGVVNHTLDNFVASDVKICGEVILRIQHHLLVSDVTHTENISRIYSHAQSFAQTRKWIDAHFPGAERVSLNSNSEAAKRVKGEWNSAAIAGELAGELYGLSSFAKNIEDQPDNSTRFLIIGKQDVGPSGDDKSAILVSTKNQPGSLYKLLEPFERHGVDLTRIETRPALSGTWNYVFFIDCVGHISQPNVQRALDEIGGFAAELKVLGSFPMGVL